MSEDRRKYLRTQGKYSDVLVNPNDRGKKNRDKGLKSSPSTIESSSKKTNERNSGGSKSQYNSTDETSSPVTYEKSSNFSFSQLENVKKPIEIKSAGPHVLSHTENGESKIIYEPDFLDKDRGNEYFDYLYDGLNWNSKNIVIHGQEYPQPRLVTWFGPFPYSYSGTTLEPAEMTPIVKEIKERVEQFLHINGIDVSFNSVLLNLYRNGKDSVAWHSDDELTMGISPTIASVSLGETRKFEMRPIVKNTEDSSLSDQLDNYFVHLTHGSLVIMTGCMQNDWQHRIPKEYHDKEARINLTFRTVYPLEKIPDHASVRETKKEKLVSPNCHRKSSDSGIHLDNEDFPPLNCGSSYLKNNLHKQSLNEVETKDDVQPLKEEQKPNISMNISLSTNKNVATSNKHEGCLIQKDSDSLDSHSKESVCSHLNVTEENNLDKETPKKWQYSESHSSINSSQDHNFDKKCASKKNCLAQEKTDITSCHKYQPDQKNQLDCKGSFNDLNHEEYNNVQDNYPNKFNSHDPNLNIKDNDCNIKRNSDKCYEVSLPGESKRFPGTEYCRSYSGGKGFVKNEHKELSNSAIKHFKKDYKEDVNSRNYENHKDFSRTQQEQKEYFNSRKYENHKNFTRKEDSRRDFKNKSYLAGNIENEDRRRHSKQNHDVEPLSHVNAVEKNNFEKRESVNENYNKEFISSTDTTGRINIDRKGSPKGLNVEAREFIPSIRPSNTANQYQQNLCLKDLIHYKFDLMEGEMLKNTSFMLRDEILKRLSDFKRDHRDELQLLCALTDGSQTEKNQRLISCRMCSTVISALEKTPPRHQRPFKENPCQYDFNHQNHYSDRGRKFQHQSRSGDYRH